MNSNTSTSQKRPATARMHAVSPRKKPRTILTTSPAGTWQVKANIGECPPYADHAAWVEDTTNNILYMYGGIYPWDANCIPTSDFYCCHTKSDMKWQNLTDELRFRDPSDPFGPIELHREERKLPRLGQPGMTFVRFNGISFIFIFGGFCLDEEKAVSRLIAVDVDHREWWYVNVDGGDVTPRINPVVVAVEQTIYVFSGYGRYSKHDPRTLRSYNIASYQLATRRWIWEARDVPYSDLIPPNHIFGAGVTVYDGKKIMLTPGRLYFQDHEHPFDFTEQKIFYFHTEHRQFQMAPHLGDFPKEVLWYTVHKLPSSHSPLAAHPPSNSRGHDLKRKAGLSISTKVIPLATSPFSPSVILCAWIPRPNSEYAVPEFWRLSLSHDDEIRCLNKSERIWDLDHDFQGCVSLDNRIILLGNNNPIGEESWNIHLDVVLTPEDRQDKPRD